MTSTAEAKLIKLADPEALAHHVADWMCDLACAKKGNFAVALSGGSTPRRLYQVLTSPPYYDKFPWDRVHWFWGDERCVPHDDEESNYHMVRAAMLTQVPVPEANIHPVPTEGIAPEAAAAVYEQELKSYYGANKLDARRALFDLVLLGLGEDGHTASLFPKTDILDVRDHWAAAVAKTKGEMRISLTYPALESAEQVAFLIVGKDKHAIFSRLQAGDKSLPAAQICPSGQLTYFVDEAVIKGQQS